ncbi:hypothetical protein RRF57_007453 [Xylaria bambusicola]|uniref:Uncharacterized protein n=1 Tax=Xylaria bambusicola TaxID=326684 RepID=A0AAN7UV63_9PEZI
MQKIEYVLSADVLKDSDRGSASSAAVVYLTLTKIGPRRRRGLMGNATGGQELFAAEAGEERRMQND